MPLTTLELDILRMLRRSAEPLSGRQIADITGVAPNTAIRTLKGLQERGFADSKTEGRATRWTTTADVAGLDELGDGSPQQRTALVVTAVDLEHTEVRNRLVNATRVRVDGIWMVEGEVFGEHINWKVYLARAGMGNATSAALVGLAAGSLGANLVAFVGIAAGLKPEDQSHGDVVVASRIHNPYMGKQVPSDSGSTLLGRDKTYAVPAPLVALVNACIADSDWTPSSRSQYYNPKHPHAFVAPIVSVEAVQNDNDGPVAEAVRTRFQDAAALDMESYGLAAGSDIHDLPVLAIRGLSDFIGDKGDVGNDGRQPDAAHNAAGVLREIMVFAHPDDFKRGQSQPPLPPDDQIDGPAFSLPGAFQLWMDRLERRSPARAASAKDSLAEMRRSKATASSWLSKALHRPPAWLREDDTGDGWALMASLASWSGSTIAWRGYERAAEAALLTGDLDAHAYFSVVARLDQLTKDPDVDEGRCSGDPDPSMFDDLDDGVLDRLGPVVDVYRAILEKDFPKTKARAEVALASLGLTDPSGVLRPPDEEIPIVEFDLELRDLVAARLLRQLAVMMLAPGAADQLGVQSGIAARTLRGNPVTRDLADDAMRLAQFALALRPTAEGTRLTLAQTTLAVLVSTTARPIGDIDYEISVSARSVEQEAMFLREAFSDWDGDSGAALAAAARARSLQGDFAGALRMLRPAPNGVASQRESRHPEVVRLGAYIAHVTGDDELALELAAKNVNRVEGQLMRASVLGSRPQMAVEAKEALLAALKESKGDHHDNFQALMALARRFNTLTSTEQATVNAHIEKLGEIDPELAHVMNARVLISQGAADEALRCVRGLERNELALEAHADALIASNRAEEAARLVFNEGIARGDIPLATEALTLATDNGLIDTAREFALNLLTRDDGKPVRLKALRALQRIAHSDSDWPQVADRTNQIIEETHASNLPVPEAEYWQLAEALYFQRKFDKGLAVLKSHSVSFNERDKAQLFLALLWSALNEARSRTGGRAAMAYLSDPDLYLLWLRAAGDWAHDEQIAAAALSVVLTAPDSDLTETQISEFREYAEKYFEQHGENASITRLKTNDNFEQLAEFLRAGEARQYALQDVARKVRAAEVPLAVLTELAGRTTTESLIRRDLGCVVAVNEDSGRGEQAARAALGGRVVVDTSALVIASWTGQTFRKLAASFDSVVLPAAVRDDIARARSSLAMKSTATIGWDSVAERPFISETSPEQAEAYAAAAEQVWTDALSLQTVPPPEANRGEQWLNSITTAQELGVTLWADDVVLRALADTLGVPSFGSIDLISALGNEDDIESAVMGFRGSKVVDLRIDRSWHSLADEAEWSVDSPFALAISRPAAWLDMGRAFAEFRSLIDHRPKDVKAESIADWTYHAANGLALATQPAARPVVVSTLLAWVIINADPFFTAVDRSPQSVNDADLTSDAGRLTQYLITTADALRNEHYPAADPLAYLVDILCSGMLESIGPEATSRIVAALAKRLDGDVGRRFFAAYIQSAGT